jgi:hypothetical protein
MIKVTKVTKATKKQKVSTSMCQQSNSLVVGKAPDKILCYDEEIDWQHKKCFYYCSNPLMFLKFESLDSAKEFIKNNKKITGPLNLYCFIAKMYTEKLEVRKNEN